jgi:hypothetical protein
MPDKKEQALCGSFAHRVDYLDKEGQEDLHRWGRGVGFSGGESCVVAAFGGAGAVSQRADPAQQETEMRKVLDCG